MMKPWSRSLVPALFLMLPLAGLAQISVDVSVNVPPPELPVYEQPPIPEDGDVWTPGYWAWDDQIQDYYWVPGTWVPVPEPDVLWTPGYWAVAGGAFLWHAGYWGPRVGFYGGVNYGHGYGGNGYEGGYWQGGHFHYNRVVNNVGNVHVTNVYEKTAIDNPTSNRFSYNGGNGIHAQPTPAQISAAHNRHIEATSAQRQHVEAARGNPSLRVSRNNGAPPVATTPRAGAFGRGGVPPSRATVPRQAQPRIPPPRPQPPIEQRRTPAQNQPPHPNAPQARPNPPRPAGRGPEHQEQHEHH